MDDLAGFYTARFGDATSGQQNGGVAVLVNGRVLGGDSGYSYAGLYARADDRIEAELDVEAHMPGWQSAFGISLPKFKVRLEAAVINGNLRGHMWRPEAPALKLPVVLTRKNAA